MVLFGKLFYYNCAAVVNSRGGLTQTARYSNSLLFCCFCLFYFRSSLLRFVWSLETASMASKYCRCRFIVNSHQGACASRNCLPFEYCWSIFVRLGRPTQCIRTLIKLLWTHTQTGRKSSLVRSWEDKAMVVLFVMMWICSCLNDCLNAKWIVRICFFRLVNNILWSFFRKYRLERWLCYYCIFGII